MAPLLNIHPAFYPIGGAVLVFRVLHSLIFAFLPIPKTVDRRAYRHKCWTYRNTVLSFFHSAVTAVLSVCWWVSHALAFIVFMFLCFLQYACAIILAYFDIWSRVFLLNSETVTLMTQGCSQTWSTRKRRCRIFSLCFLWVSCTKLS